MGKQFSNLLNLTQAAEAAGVTRKTLYAHIDKGLLSVTRKQNKRYIDVSELIRHYGDVSLPVKKINTTTHTQSNHEGNGFEAMKTELVALRTLLEQQQLLLQDKVEAEQLREEMIALQNDRERIEAELTQLKAELHTERQKGFLQRLFKR